MRSLRAHAQITPPLYDVTFYVNGAVYKTLRTSGNEVLTFPDDPAAQGDLAFDGWYLDENVWKEPFTETSLQNQALTGNLAVYAKWSKRQVTVTYVTNGGTQVPATTVTAGEPVPYPVTDKKNFVFAGWYDNPELTGEPVYYPYYPTKNVTLYADWAETTVTVDGFTLAYQFSETGTSASGYVIRSYSRPENAVGLTFPEGYKNIPLVEISNSFANDLDETAKASVTSLVIPDGVERIGNNALQSLPNLTTLRLGKGLKYIAAGAFRYCTKLENITFCGALEYVGRLAFDESCPWYASQPDGAIYTDNVLYDYKGTAPESYAVREGTVSIGEYAFLQQKTLRSVTLPDSVVSIGNYAFSQSGLTQIDLPADLAMLDSYVFFSCSNLTSVTFPEGFAFDADHMGWKFGMFRFGDGIFRYCSNLTSVTLSDVCEIPGSTFAGCTSLTSITLPASVKNVSLSAFEESGLTEITILSDTPIQMDTRQLPDTLTKIYVPQGMKSVIEQQIAADENFAVYWKDSIDLVTELA